MHFSEEKYHSIATKDIAGTNEPFSIYFKGTKVLSTSTAPISIFFYGHYLIWFEKNREVEASGFTRLKRFELSVAFTHSKKLLRSHLQRKGISQSWRSGPVASPIPISSRHPQTLVVVQGWRADVEVDLAMSTLLDEAPDSPGGSAEHDNQEVGENPVDEHVEN
jgi:hypothetical protein